MGGCFFTFSVKIYLFALQAGIQLVQTSSKSSLSFPWQPATRGKRKGIKVSRKMNGVQRKKQFSSDAPTIEIH